MDGGTAELRETHRLVGHADRAWALAWNPNPGAGAGPVLASCGGDKTVRIWKRAPDGAWHCSVRPGYFSVFQGSTLHCNCSDWFPFLCPSCLIRMCSKACTNAR